MGSLAHLVACLNADAGVAIGIPACGWLGEAKVSCSFCHWGALLILAYSWARPAVFAAGKGRG